MQCVADILAMLEDGCNRHGPEFYCWRCPVCGGGLEDLVEVMRRDGGLRNEIVLEITRTLVRFHCVECDCFFGEQELKDKIYSA